MEKSITLGRTSLALLVLFLQTVFGNGSANATPDSDLLEFWQVHDEQSMVEVSHQQWQDLLDAYLDADHESGINRFNYAAVSEADRAILKKYLQYLQAQDPRKLALDEQLAYWINFYNSITVQVVLNKYPVESIRSIRFLSSPFGPWDKNLVKVQGQSLSLNDIEHGILRPIWKDPRIHFAVNCASLGCPNLVDEAFTASNVDELMDEAASDFINHPRGAKIQGNKVVLSSIFDWYGQDFGRNESEILSYLSSFFDKDVASLDGLRDIEYQYDWDLNKP
jgi:hypothetical protein